jgi:alanine-glyoxylate transaminase/serine-glyoxylate transaminase/serine-pyruvate transaminase
MSHVSAEFVPVLGDCIRMIRRVLLAVQDYKLFTVIHRDVLFTKDAQPFIISGSGTLGWDQARSGILGRVDSVLTRLFVGCSQSRGIRRECTRVEQWLLWG